MTISGPTNPIHGATISPVLESRSQGFVTADSQLRQAEADSLDVGSVALQTACSDDVVTEKPVAIPREPESLASNLPNVHNIGQDEERVKLENEKRGNEDEALEVRDKQEQPEGHGSKGREEEREEPGQENNEKREEADERSQESGELVIIKQKKEELAQEIERGWKENEEQGQGGQEMEEQDKDEQRDEKKYREGSRARPRI